MREGHVAESIVIVDGLFGCGKTMLAPIVGALDRVELLTYAYPLEYVCALHSLQKITDDAAVAMIRMLTDLQLYNTMMARETNFRPRDLSSALRSAHPLLYICRLFTHGDEAVPAAIAVERPILHLTTHNLLAYSMPIFQALGARVLWLNVVRHPLYMLKQQTIDMESLIGNPRDFTVYVSGNGRQIPYYAAGWKDEWSVGSSIDRAIAYSAHVSHQADTQQQRVQEKFSAQIITIPFEQFVLNPWPFIYQISAALKTTVTTVTRRVMRKQRVPRKKIAEGVALSIYKKYGWEPGDGHMSERDELGKRRQYAVEHGASAQSLRMLDAVSQDYETRYMQTILS